MDLSEHLPVWLSSTSGANWRAEKVKCRIKLKFNACEDRDGKTVSLRDVEGMARELLVSHPGG